MTKSRWHIPTQTAGTCLALLGYFLGHGHGGREFIANNVHSLFAYILQFLLIVQILFGVYLRGHWENGLNGRIRRLIRPCHSVVGKAMPLLAWTQLVFGGITALGFCQGDHLGQCAAHFIMGSSFVAYGILLNIVLLVGQVWMRRTGRSQEFFDSCGIAGWGCVNTFTEHRWGTAWVRNDWQHTTLGVIWWCAGLAGIWLSKDRDGRPKRHFVPGFVFFITGWAMSAHPQELHVSEATHAMFGYTLMVVGITRIVEISFVVRDEQSLAPDGRSWNSFQYIPVYVSSLLTNALTMDCLPTYSQLIYASGFLFMGATEEQMVLIDQSDMDHVSYILILFSIAFMVFLFSNMLIHLYDRRSGPVANSKDFENGYAPANVRPMEEGHARDAEEFELGGLSSDDEEGQGMLRRNRDGSSRPAGVGI